MSDPLLTYAVSANQVPIQASPQTGATSVVTLMIVVSNDTHKLIDCESISFSFFQGTDAQDFFSDSTGIGTSATTGWSINQSGALFTATPDTVADGEIGASGLTFILSGIKVNEQPGTTNMTITEVTVSNTGTLEVPLAKFPQQFEVGDLVAIPTPPIVNQGDNITLSWSGTGGKATYALSYADEDGHTVTITETKDVPPQPLPSTGSYTIDDLQVTPMMTFYLVVTLQIPGQDQPLLVQRQCTVTVNPPQPTIYSFTIAANPVIPGQQLSFTLNWDVIGSFQITANDGQSGQQRVLPIPNNATSYLVIPTQLTTTYTLTVFPPGVHSEEEEKL